MLKNFLYQIIVDYISFDLCFIDIGPPASVKEVRFLTALRELPFALPFADRVRVLQGLLNAERSVQHGDAQDFLRGPAISIKLRRSHLYEDAFDKLSIQNG